MAADSETSIRAVAVLSYKDGREGRRYLLRRGDALEGESDGAEPKLDAVSLMRDVGWRVASDMLMPLGECRKGATLACALFAVSLTGREKAEPVDPFPSRTAWVTAPELASSHDPLAHVLLVRLSEVIEPALRFPSLRLVRDVDDFEVGLTEDGYVSCSCPAAECPSGDGGQTTLGRMIQRAYEHIDQAHDFARLAKRAEAVSANG